MMDNYKAGRTGQNPEDSSQGDPLHVKRFIARWRAGDVNELRFDPETAHARAGDPSYETRIPASCGLCQAQELSQKAAQAAAGMENGGSI